MAASCSKWTFRTRLVATRKCLSACTRDRWQPHVSVPCQAVRHMKGSTIRLASIWLLSIILWTCKGISDSISVLLGKGYACANSGCQHRLSKLWLRSLDNLWCQAVFLAPTLIIPDSLGTRLGMPMMLNTYLLD